MDKRSQERLVACAKNVRDTQRPSSRKEDNIHEIWLLLQDGEWHTAEKIAKHVGYSPKYLTDQFMPALKQAWGLASGRYGYCLPSPEKPIIV